VSSGKLKEVIAGREIKHWQESVEQTQYTTRGSCHHRPAFLWLGPIWQSKAFQDIYLKREKYNYDWYYWMGIYLKLRHKKYLLVNS
jgi:hypothetical protein